MPEVKRLLAGYKAFREGYFQENHALFSQLYEQGQPARAMIISCCDSRVDPTIIFGAEPGELFVVRNVANLVPPFETDPTFHGTSAAIEFAIKALNVRYIIVLGHAKCGGIQASLNAQEDSDTVFIDNWLKITTPAKDEVLKKLGDAPQEEQLVALEKRSIVNSIHNLTTFPFVSEKLKDGSMKVLGWYFDIRSGTVLAYDPEIDDFRMMQES